MDRLTVVHQSHRAALGVGESQFVVDAEGVVDRGGEVFGFVAKDCGIVLQVMGVSVV